MLLDSLTPWLPIVVAGAAALAAVAAVAKGMLGMFRHVRRRIIERRARKIVAAVTPLLDERFQVVDTAMLNMRLELAATTKVVNQVKAIVSNGLTADVAYLRDRVDRIWEHLVD